MSKTIKELETICTNNSTDIAILRQENQRLSNTAETPQAYSHSLPSTSGILHQASSGANNKCSNNLITITHNKIAQQNNENNDTFATQTFINKSDTNTQLKEQLMTNNQL